MSLELLHRCSPKYQERINGDAAYFKQCILTNSQRLRQKNSIMTLLKCDVCQAACSHQICFVLKPCNHVTCIKCFHQALPASYAMQCPCSECQKWIESSALFEVSHDLVPDEDNPVSVGTETALELLQTSPPIQEVIHFEPDEQMDPFRHWAMKKPDLYSGFIYVSFRCNDEEASFYRSNFRASNSTVFIDDDSSEELVKIFARVLHPLLFRKDFVNHQHHEGMASDTRSQDSCTEESCPFPSDKERRQLALKSIYALSSGKVMSDKEEDVMSCDKLWSHNNIKQKAIECAKDLAKELLTSKRKMRHVAAPTTPKRHGRKRYGKRDTILSPILENQPRVAYGQFTSLKLVPNCEGPCQTKTRAETQIPCMLGFLLLGAAWMMSQ